MITWKNPSGEYSEPRLVLVDIDSSDKALLEDREGHKRIATDKAVRWFTDNMPPENELISVVPYNTIE